MQRIAWPGVKQWPASFRKSTLLRSRSLDDREARRAEHFLELLKIEPIDVFSGARIVVA
jgi:hypothetical protein